MNFVLKSCIADVDMQKVKDSIISNLNKDVRALYVSTDYDKRLTTEVRKLDDKNLIFKIFGTRPSECISRSFSIDYFLKLDNDILKLMLSREVN